MQQNKALAVRWLDQVSDHDIEAMLATTTPDWRMHGGPPDLATGPDGIRSLFEHIGPVRQKWIVEDVIGEGDRVVIRATNFCEQESFFGLPAAGITQVFTATFIFRMADGMVAEIWRNADDFGRYLQVGGVITGRAAS
ncbi:MAG: nuclear transport factor 2 family protein [Propionibacteriaceae bacterium]